MKTNKGVYRRGRGAVNPLFRMRRAAVAAIEVCECVVCDACTPALAPFLVARHVLVVLFFALGCCVVSCVGRKAREAGRHGSSSPQVDEVFPGFHKSGEVSPRFEHHNAL